MKAFLNSPLTIRGLTLSHRLIQGPLAGYSCAPFRQAFDAYQRPAYCVSEMISAKDALDKHQPDSRYLYRAPNEGVLCYQLSGTDPAIVAAAAQRVSLLGAQLVDLNCGCPKAKIRKKGAGSALLESPERLFSIIRAVREAICLPLTVKIRLLGDARELALAKGIEAAGADALIVHARRWVDDYDVPCAWDAIARIKQAVSLPVIANGDIRDTPSLVQAFSRTGCDAYMISRAGCGAPWLYQQLLTGVNEPITHDEVVYHLMMHLRRLAALDSEHQAVLQSKSLVRYYLKDRLNDENLRQFYCLGSLNEIEEMLKKHSVNRFYRAPV
jgi:tRNA-dihydrouridine synthase B